MFVRALWGLLLCEVLILCLCGCRPEQGVVYQHNLDDTWQAVQRATRQTIGTAPCSEDEKEHIIYTPCFSCDSGLRNSGVTPHSPDALGTGKWNDPNMSQEDTISNDKDSIRYGTTEAPSKEHRCRETYWYAIIRCKARGTGTQVLVSIERMCKSYQTRDRNGSQTGDTCSSCQESEACSKAYEWSGKFYAELNKELENQATVSSK